MVLASLRCVRSLLIMRSDPASEFLAQFVRDNQDVIDKRTLDPETGLPRMKQHSGLFDKSDENGDEDESNRIALTS